MSLFNLAARATSRESAYLSKERRIPHTEYSPTLQLIRSSEVDPFKGAPGSSTSGNARSQVKAPTAPIAPSPRNLPRRPIIHPPELLNNGDEQLRAVYKTAVTNLENQVRDARQKLVHVRRRYQICGIVLVVAAGGVISKLWPGYRHMNEIERHSRNRLIFEEQEMMRRAAMTNARDEGNISRTRKKRRHTIRDQMPVKADAKSSSWKGWFWAQPHA